MKRMAKMLMGKCSQCGETWQLRVSSPKKCPNCQSRNWDKPVTVYRRKAAAGRKEKR